MKISTAKAAIQLKLTLPELLDTAAPLLNDLSEAWPEIDDGYVATMLQLLGLDPQATKEQASISQSSKSRVELSIFDETKYRILDKLERTGRWGGNAVSLNTLKNHYCHGLSHFDKCLDDLIDAELVLVSDKGSKRKGPFSLNPAMKGVIEDGIAKIRE